MRTKSLKFIPSKEVQYLSEDERDKYYLTLRAMGQNIERYDSIVLVPETLKLAQVGVPYSYHTMGPITFSFLKRMWKTGKFDNTWASEQTFGETIRKFVIERVKNNDVGLYFFNKYASSDYDEFPIFSFIALNEFLSTTVMERTYKDYLDEHWDRIYEDFQSFNIQLFPHTEQLAKSFNFSRNSYYSPIYPQIIHHGWLKKKDHANIESLTRQDMKTLFEGPKSWYQGTVKSSFSHKLELMIAWLHDGVEEKMPSSATVMEELRFLYRDAVARTPIVQIPKLEATSIMEACIRNMCSKQMTDEINRVTINQVSTARIQSIIRHVAELELKAQDVMLFIYVLANRSAFSNTGNYHATISFFEEAIQHLETNDFIDLIHCLGDMAMEYDDALPTLTDWQKAVQDKMDFTLPPSLLISLIDAPEQRTKPRKAPAMLKALREVLKT